MKCHQCEQEVTLLQRGALTKSDDLKDHHAVLHRGVWCRQCVDDLVTFFARCVKMAMESPPVDPDPPPGREAPVLSEEVAA